jgi:hypothetical protein
MSYSKIDPKLEAVVTEREQILARLDKAEARIDMLIHQLEQEGDQHATRQPETAQGDACCRQGREQDRYPAQGRQGIRQVGQGQQIAGPQDFPQAVIYKITPL